MHVITIGFKSGRTIEFEAEDFSVKTTGGKLLGYIGRRASQSFPLHMDIESIEYVNSKPVPQ